MAGVRISRALDEGGTAGGHSSATIPTASDGDVPGFMAQSNNREASPALFMECMGLARVICH